MNVNGSGNTDENTKENGLSVRPSNRHNSVGESEAVAPTAVPPQIPNDINLDVDASTVEKKLWLKFNQWRQGGDILGDIDIGTTVPVHDNADVDGTQYDAGYDYVNEPEPQQPVPSRAVHFPTPVASAARTTPSIWQSPQIPTAPIPTLAPAPSTHWDTSGLVQKVFAVAPDRPIDFAELILNKRHPGRTRQRADADEDEVEAEEQEAGVVWRNVATQKVGVLGYSVYLWIGLVCTIVLIAILYLAMREFRNARAGRKFRHHLVMRLMATRGYNSMQMSHTIFGPSSGDGLDTTRPSFAQLAWDVNCFVPPAPIRLGQLAFNTNVGRPIPSNNGSNTSNANTMLTNGQMFDMWSSVTLHMPPPASTGEDEKKDGWFSAICGRHRNTSAHLTSLGGDAFPMPVTPEQEWSSFWSADQIQQRTNALNTWTPVSSANQQSDKVMVGNTLVDDTLSRGDDVGDVASDLLRVLQNFDRTHTSRTLLLGPESRVQSWDAANWQRLDTAHTMWTLRRHHQIPTNLFLRPSDMVQDEFNGIADGNNVSGDKNEIGHDRGTVPSPVLRLRSRRARALWEATNQSTATSSTQTQNVTRYLSQLVHQPYRQSQFWSQ